MSMTPRTVWSAPWHTVHFGRLMSGRYARKYAVPPRKTNPLSSLKKSSWGGRLVASLKRGVGIVAPGGRRTVKDRESLDLQSLVHALDRAVVGEGTGSVSSVERNRRAALVMCVTFVKYPTASGAFPESIRVSTATKIVFALSLEALPRQLVAERDQ